MKKETQVSFKISLELKKAVDLYCLLHQIKRQDYFSKQWTGIITKITVLNAGTKSELKYADIKYFNDYGDAYNYKMKPFESLISVN